MIEKTPYLSWKRGTLAKGCQQCVKGDKSVFFITGLCSKNCFYCPISDEKKNHDVMYINEWATKAEDEVLEEIRLCNSKGVGITGGDPLARFERTVYWIGLLKKEFGKEFHIHIYLPLELVTEKKLSELYHAGLDEVRFHPDLVKDDNWERLSLAKKFDWDVGVEIPVVPEDEDKTVELLDFIAGKVDFLNLNELELSDTNYNEILEHGYKTKDGVSYGVRGSAEMAHRLMEYVDAKGYDYSIHFCTCTLKDKVQLTTRMQNRVRNVAMPYDDIDDEGLLIRGAIYPVIEPGFSYRKKISSVDKKKALETLILVKKELHEDLGIPEEFLGIDDVKLRVLTHQNIAREIASEIEWPCAIVKEYPTHDMFEIEIEIIS